MVPTPCSQQPPQILPMPGDRHGFGMGCAPQLATLSAPSAPSLGPHMLVHQYSGALWKHPGLGEQSGWIPVIPGLLGPPASPSRHPEPSPRAGAEAPSPPPSCCSSAPLSHRSFGSSSFPSSRAGGLGTAAGERSQFPAKCNLSACSRRHQRDHTDLPDRGAVEGTGLRGSARRGRDVSPKDWGVPGPDGATEPGCCPALVQARARTTSS